MALFVLGLPKGSLQTTKVGLPQLCGAITNALPSQELLAKTFDRDEV
jgi:hypothetical protein